MSISKFQEKFLNEKGCGTIFAILISGVMLTFGMAQCSRMNGGGGDAEGQSPDQVSIATVGNIPVTQSDITSLMEKEQSQQPGMPSNFQMKANMEAGAVDGALRGAANLYLAREAKVPFDDASVIKIFADEMTGQIMQAKMQIAQQKKLKPTDTKGLDDAFKAQYGASSDEMLQKLEADLKGTLADNNKKNRVYEEAAPQLLEAAVETTIKPTDQELRHSMDSYVTKQITIKDGPDADKQILAAQNALKTGKSFEQVMDQYSSAPAAKGQKKSDATSDIPQNMVSLLPAYKELDGQKPGYVSGILSTYMGKQIIKIIAMKNTAPKDFDKQRAMLAKQYASQNATKKVQDEIKDLLASSATKWQSQGYKALEDFEQAMSNTDNTAKAAALQKVMDEAEAANKSGQVIDMEASLAAWYLAEDGIYQTPGANKASMRDGRIDLLTRVLASNEDHQIRMELVSLYEQKKDGPNAVAQLVAAAKNNTSTDPSGQQAFGDIAAAKDRLQKEGLATATDIKAINDAQAGFQKLMKDAADMKTQQEEEEKKQKAASAETEKQNEALIKQQEAEVNKNKPAAPGKTPGSSATTGSATGSSAPPAASGKAPGASSMGATPPPSSPAPNPPAQGKH